MRKSVLWGHHWDEYQGMFALNQDDLKGSILEYGCGASAVNAELHQQGVNIISMDPLFSQNIDTLQQEVDAIFESRIQQMMADKEDFNFDRYGGLEALVSYRRQGIKDFFKDYPSGKKAGRYLALQEQSLPFKDFQFDLALCAHYFFADAGDIHLTTQLASILALTRVAKEIRIFPLIDRFGKPSPLIGPVLLALQQANLGVEVRDVSYHLQSAGHAMLRVWAQECALMKPYGSCHYGDYTK